MKKLLMFRTRGLAGPMFVRNNTVLAKTVGNRKLNQPTQPPPIVSECAPSVTHAPSINRVPC